MERVVEKCWWKTWQNGLLVTDTIKIEDFWDDEESVLYVTKPIYLMVNFCDSEGSKTGEIYEKVAKFSVFIVIGLYNGISKFGLHKILSWGLLNLFMLCYLVYF